MGFMTWNVHTVTDFMSMRDTSSVEQPRDRYSDHFRDAYALPQGTDFFRIGLTVPQFFEKYLKKVCF
jgi:hypothetical protein